MAEEKKKDKSKSGRRNSRANHNGMESSQKLSTDNDKEPGTPSNLNISYDKDKSPSYNIAITDDNNDEKAKLRFSGIVNEDATPKSSDSPKLALSKASENSNIQKSRFKRNKDASVKNSVKE